MATGQMKFAGPVRAFRVRVELVVPFDVRPFFLTPVLRRRGWDWDTVSMLVGDKLLVPGRVACMDGGIDGVCTGIGNECINGLDDRLIE